MTLDHISLPPIIEPVPQKITGRSKERWIRGQFKIGSLVRTSRGWYRVTEGTMVRYSTHASRPAVRIELVTDSAAAELESRARLVVAADEAYSSAAADGPMPYSRQNPEVISLAKSILSHLPNLQRFC